MTERSSTVTTVEGSTFTVNISGSDVTVTDSHAEGNGGGLLADATSGNLTLTDVTATNNASRNT